MAEFNDYIAIYQEQLLKGKIQKAYTGLIKYVKQLEATFKRNYFESYSFGNASAGYMDYTYFPFFDDYLREKKLRFGIVLNHRQMRFELWLMGQNATIQKKYWELLKGTVWNAHLKKMPKYAAVQIILCYEPDFSNPDQLSTELIQQAVSYAEDITEYLEEYAN